MGRGLTLLEVIIAIALIAMLVSALLTFYWQTLQLRDASEKLHDRTAIVRQVLGQISGELRAALPAERVNFPVTRFIGERRKITFVTAWQRDESDEAFRTFRESERYDQPLPRQDLREVTYELWIEINEQTEEGDPVVGGLLRTERRLLDPTETEADVPEGEVLPYIQRNLWAHELGYLEFRYFDGVQWHTQWEVQEGNPLPHLIQVTVGFDALKRFEHENEDLNQYTLEDYPLGPDVPNINRFSQIVRVAGADPMFSGRLQNLRNSLGEETFTFGGTVPEGEEGGAP
ncbi:MAG: prepilin-type N-terminal cleavage/methylation domain-containing protein [Phycisphaerales bacterium]|nr:prepilin-type N-terminal cleavage/methylation domain-containing protein [Phycisphaerales bacterium]